MTDLPKCEECEAYPLMFEEDGTGWCYEHAVEHATEEWEKEQEEERTGVSEFQIGQRALEKRISFPKAKEELIRELQSVMKCEVKGKEQCKELAFYKVRHKDHHKTKAFFVCKKHISAYQFVPLKEYGRKIGSFIITGLWEATK